MHSHAKKNFDSPLLFAVKTFQQSNFTDMIFYRQRIANLPVQVETEVQIWPCFYLHQKAQAFRKTGEGSSGQSRLS